KQNLAECGGVQFPPGARGADDGNRATALHRLEVNDRTIAQYTEIDVYLVLFRDMAQLGLTDLLEIAARDICLAHLECTVTDTVFLAILGALDKPALHQCRDITLDNARRDLQTPGDLANAEILPLLRHHDQHLQRPYCRLTASTGCITVLIIRALFFFHE